MWKFDGEKSFNFKHNFANMFWKLFLKTININLISYIHSENNFNPLKQNHLYATVGGFKERRRENATVILYKYERKRDMHFAWERERENQQEEREK